MAILSRSFCNCSIEKDISSIEEKFKIGIQKIREYEEELKTKNIEFFKDNYCVLVEKIDLVSRKVVQ